MKTQVSKYPETTTVVAKVMMGSQTRHWSSCLHVGLGLALKGAGIVPFFFPSTV